MLRGNYEFPEIYAWHNNCNTEATNIDLYLRSAFRLANQNSAKSRLGFHYFPDTEHYSHADLKRWLPILEALNIGWLVLVAPGQRAIPEFFVRELLKQGIQPILHFHLPLGVHIDQAEIAPLLKAYSQWGVRYAAIYDRPNVRTSWETSTWAQNNLVEQFLDLYAPLARLLLTFGLTPIFPPLEPGGDFWDTAFLRLALRSLLRRSEEALLEKLHLGAYGFTGAHPWNWGAGGPERWPGARPYHTPEAEQDHRSFRIFEWYTAIAQAEIGNSPPVYLLGAGNLASPFITAEDSTTSREFIAIWKSLQNKQTRLSASFPALGQELGACCFWLLSAEPWSRFSAAACFTPERKPTLAGKIIMALQPGSAGEISRKSHVGFDNPLPMTAYPLSHYVLLPKDYHQNGAASNQNIISLLDRKKVISGYSVLDAALARKVIVCDAPGGYSPQQIQQLEKAGCEIVACKSSGIELAQILAKL